MNNNKVRKEIGEHLTKRMKELGYTLYRINKETGLQYQQIRSILTGETGYSINSLIALMLCLNVSLEFSHKITKSIK